MSNVLSERQQFWAALMFYTRLPTPKSYQHTDDNFELSRKYLPLVGVLVGLCAATVFALSYLLLPLSVSIALSMISSILLTGAFHEDGFADCCDGFGGGWEKGQVLTIMKDSRVGTYATVGLIGLLSLKFVALYEIARHSKLLVCLVMLNGHAISRFAASITIEMLEYVQDTDASKIRPVSKLSLSRTQLVYSASFVVPALLALVYLEPLSVSMYIPLVAMFYCLSQYFKKRIGGYTGDCLGAMQQVIEVTLYIAVLAIL